MSGVDLNAIEWPRHNGGLSVEHNQHVADYVTVEEAIGSIYDRSAFKTEGSLAECIRTASVWCIHWYPDTPIGSYCVCAPTLAEAYAFAVSVQAADDLSRRP